MSRISWLDSCYKDRIIPDCRSRIFPGNGSTCPHALIRSSLISAKVRTLSPHYFVCCSTPYVSRVWCGCIDANCAGRNAIGLESVTQGLARATSHRVLSPAAGTSPRYSVPFFQNIAQDLRLGEHILQCAFSVPEIAKASNFSLLSLLVLTRVGPSEVLKLKEQRGELGKTECKWNSSVCGERPYR
jgi:hypothetical protein